MPAGWNNPAANGLIVPLGANLTMEPLPAVLFPPLLTYRLPFESKARPVGPPSPKFATNVVIAPDGAYLRIDPVEALLIAKRLPAASNAIPAGIIPVAKSVCPPAGVILTILLSDGSATNRLPLLSNASQSALKPDLKTVRL